MTRIDQVLQETTATVCCKTREGWGTMEFNLVFCSAMHTVLMIFTNLCAHEFPAQKERQLAAGGRSE